MAYCANCGKKIEDDARFCPGCGTPVGGATQANGQNTAQANGQYTSQTGEQNTSQKTSSDTVNDFTDKIKEMNNTKDTTSEIDPKDIENNKVISVFGYLGILWVIPFFGAKNSQFAQYHSKQGFNLFLVEIAYSIISTIIRLVIRVPRYVYGFNIGNYTPGWLSAILWLLSVPIIVLVVIGIINTVNGRAKELPVIGKYKIIK